MGQKGYELDCTAKIEFLRDCFWDWDPTFVTDPKPLPDYYTVKDDHEIAEIPPSPPPPSNDGRVYIQGIRPLPSFMRHYWHKGEQATLSGIRLSFMKTEQGWRDEKGIVY